MGPGLFSLPWDSSSPQYRIVRLEIVPVSVHHEIDDSGRLNCGLPPVDHLQESTESQQQSPFPALPAFSFRADDAAETEENSEGGGGGVVEPLSLSFSYDVVFQPIAMILLRVLYRDISRYNDLLADEEDVEEKGWKLLHGDVFRKPAHSTVLAALTGSGMQLVGMAFVTVIFAGLGVFSPAFRGSLLQTMLILWTVMGAVAGYTSARMYKLFKSVNWKMTTIRTALVFPGVVFSVFFLMNVVLWSQQSSAAVSFTGLLALLALWFGISIPLVFAGAYYGFKQPAISIPVRINKIPRQVPQQPWFMHPALCSLVGGALPFGAMLTELFFLFSCIWQHRFYYLFGFLFLVLIILCITCAEISITFVYFQLVW
ncbi:endomembrane domain70-containing protein, putative [Eimeria mitis]|uniref:Transmembrane 9 superfamily member n=1 Tax=Eimeria mitis TaxID=44415 RepID=U6JX46_9EIME|nr:endomembrane domain70-containing protein, putative [Eimeria mitis]CDJ28098.1 endomembrane domain70-containing protein, putative [Eimeria mitis]